MRGRFGNIGSLDRRIIIKQVTRVTDTFGEPIETFTTLTTIWAERIDNRGLTGESYEADQLTAVRRVDWKVRYLSTIREDMLLNYDNEDYIIREITELGRKWGMILKTELKR